MIAFLIYLTCFQFQISRSVMSDSLWPHEPQHTRPPCPSPTPEVYPNPYPLSQWCHPTILSSVTPFSSCPQSFPALGSFQMSQLFELGGQSIGVSASTSEHSGLISFRMDWFDLLAVQGTLKSLLQHHSSKASIHQCSAFFIVQLSYPYITTGKMHQTIWFIYLFFSSPWNSLRAKVMLYEANTSAQGPEIL